MFYELWDFRRTQVSWILIRESLETFDQIQKLVVNRERTSRIVRLEANPMVNE